MKKPIHKWKILVAIFTVTVITAYASVGRMYNIHNTVPFENISSIQIVHQIHYADGGDETLNDIKIVNKNDIQRVYDIIDHITFTKNIIDRNGPIGYNNSIEHILVMFYYAEENPELLFFQIENSQYTVRISRDMHDKTVNYSLRFGGKERAKELFLALKEFVSGTADIDYKMSK